jgi:putative ABC transport system permease protein
VAVEGRAPDPPGHEPEADARAASPTYFADTGMRLVAGRAFTDADRADAPKVVIVNESLARRLFGKESPVGRRLRYTFDAAQPWREIVGVVADARLSNLAEPPHPAVYDPFAQDVPPDTNLLVRTTGAPETFVPALRRTLRELDPDLLVWETRSLESVVASAPSTFLRQYPSRVVGVFSMLALLLAVLGIYGVTSFSVARRTREIGVRVAVGARPKDVLALVLSSGARLAAIGTAAGLLASLFVGRALTRLLFGVSAADASTLAGSVLCVLAAALLATLVPALRALRVEPTTALRTE